MIRQTVPAAARHGFAALALAALALSACEDDTPTDNTETAEITLTFSPSPATATASPNPNFEWRTSFSVTVAETAGIAATITSVSTTLYEAAGGIVIGTPDQDEDVVVSVTAGSNQLPALGSVPIGFTIDYRLDGEGREALVDVTVVVVDDNDLAVADTERVGVL